MSLKDKGRKPDAVLFQLACGRVNEPAARGMPINSLSRLLHLVSNCLRFFMGTETGKWTALMRSHFPLLSVCEVIPAGENGKNQLYSNDSM